MLALWVSTWRRARRKSTFGMVWKVAGSAKCARCAFESLLCGHPPTEQSPEALLGAFSNKLSAKMATSGPHLACNWKQLGTYMWSNFVQEIKGLWGADWKVGFKHFAARY